MRYIDEHNGQISGDTIRSVRDHWAFTRYEFAQCFGVTPGTVYHWERYGVTRRSNKFDYSTYRVLKLSRDILGDNNK